jgi:hypothetical protein
MYLTNSTTLMFQELLSIVMVALWGTLSDKISTRPVLLYSTIANDRLQQ